MSRALGMILALLAVTACGSTTVVSLRPSPSTSAATSPSASIAATTTPSEAPSPSPALSPAPASAYAVLVDLLSSAGSYNANLVDANARVWASLRLGQRTPIVTAGGHAIALPYVSTTSTTLYALDGNSSVYALRLPDGQQRVATTLPVAAGQEAAFSVSPDDSRIAYTVLDFNRTPVTATLYTDALAGGHRKAIFQSNSDYVWPIAWRGGLIVLAHAAAVFDEAVATGVGGWDNPYHAISYHLVDPATAQRRALMGACNVSGPLSPAGSACMGGDVIDWNGKVTSWHTPGASLNSAASLSADGSLIATVIPQEPTHLAACDRIVQCQTYPAALDPRNWVGWLGGAMVTGSYLDPNWQPQVVGQADSSTQPVPAEGFVAAILPANVV